MARKVELLYSLRDERLEKLHVEIQIAHQGLSQAARAAKHAGIIDGTSCSKFIQIDFAYNLIRHLTTAHYNE